MVHHIHRHSDVTKLDSIYGSHVVGRSCMYCNRKKIVCGLPDANWLTHWQFEVRNRQALPEFKNCVNGRFSCSTRSPTWS